MTRRSNDEHPPTLLASWCSSKRAVLRRNVEIVARGPLPADHVEAIRAAFNASDPGWWRGET